MLYYTKGYTRHIDIWRDHTSDKNGDDMVLQRKLFQKMTAKTFRTFLQHFNGILNKLNRDSHFRKKLRFKSLFTHICYYKEKGKLCTVQLIVVNVNSI